jgi:Transglutaminase-like superfamily
VPQAIASTAAAIAIFAAVALIGCRPSAHKGPQSSGVDAAKPTRIAATDAQRQKALAEYFQGLFRGSTRFGELCTKTTHDDGAHEYSETATARSMFYVDGHGFSVTLKFSKTFSDQAPYPLLTAYVTSETDGKPKRSKTLRRVGDQYERSIDGAVENVDIDYTFDDVLTGDIWLAGSRRPNETLCTRMLSGDLKIISSELRVLDNPPNMLDGKVVTSAFEMLGDGDSYRCYKSGAVMLLMVSPIGEIRHETAEEFAAGQLNAIPIGEPVTATGTISGIADVSSMTVRVKGDLVAHLADGAGQTVQRLSDTEALVTVDQHAVAATEEDRLKYSKQEPIPAELQSIVAEVRGMNLAAYGPERAAALIEVVHRHLKPDLAAKGSGLASAVADGRGVCLHFARLFEVLARACDLPARTVGGLASGGHNQFGPHEWVQILYDGGWHSIDPTFRMLKAPAHIQFANGGFFADPNTQIEVVQINRTTDHWWTIGAAIAMALVIAIGVGFNKIWRARATSAQNLSAEGSG